MTQGWFPANGSELKTLPLVSLHLVKPEVKWEYPSGFIRFQAMGNSLTPGMRATRACLSWLLLPDWASWSAAGPVSCSVKLVGCPCTSASCHSGSPAFGPSEKHEEPPLIVRTSHFSAGHFLKAKAATS